MAGEPLRRLTAVVWAQEAERVVAEACARLGAGCQERDLGSGRVALDFWVDGDATRPAGVLREVLREAGADGGLEEADEADDWRDALRRHHRPVTIAGRLHLRPPWTDPVPGLVDVVIDPGMAFGTGQHATTRGCLQLMAGLPAEGAFLDLGCGSGVLAIAARRLGFPSVRAIDLDPLAIEATLANARANGVGLAAAPLDVLRACFPWAPTVAANLVADVLVALAPRVGGGVRRMIISGLRDDEAPEVVAAYERRGLGLRDTVSADGWTSALVVRA